MRRLAKGLLRWRSPTFWLVAVCVSLILVLVTSVVMTTAKIEQESDAREEQLISNGIHIAIERLNAGIESQTLWDDAVVNLDTQFDAKWAAQYLTEYLWANGQYNLIYLLNSDDQPIYASQDRKAINPARFAAIRARLEPVIRAVRAGESHRGPLVRGDARVPTPIRGYTIVRQGPDIFMVTAGLVQPDNSRGVAPSQRGAIVVAGQRIDGVFLARLAHLYLIHDLRRDLVNAPSDAGRLGLVVGQPGDSAAFRLTWKRNSPTSKLILTAGPALAAVFLALACAPFLVLHNGRRNQELKTASEAAKLASQAKSSFLATMSHEIRTPMNGIIGLAHIMKFNDLSEPQRERLEIILTSSKALVSILNDALDLSKIESGKLELEHEPFDLGDLARSARDAFAAIAIQKGFDLSLDVAPEADAAFVGDAVRVRQIIHNLVANAVKFTDRGGVALKIDVCPGGVRILVSDTGCGIAPNRISRLFERFVQEDNSTTRRYGGTGLGLAICRDLCAAMQGSISVESELGRGTRFTVTLPLERSAVKPVAVVEDMVLETNLSGQDARPLRVLVAEDNVINQQVISALLEQVGITPAIVDDGVKAVEAWSLGDWDLIFLDVCMPVMDGPTAARRIRSREIIEGRPRTPIIALTANVMNHQIEDYAQAGMDQVVAKPIEVGVLFRTMEAALALASGEDAEILLDDQVGNA